MSCRSSKTVTQQTHNETVHDTIRETTTITIQTNETGDTTRLTTNRDREKITSRNRTSDHTHHTTRSETDSTTKETTTASPISPIQPINPQSPIKPLLFSFLLGLLLIPLIKLCRRIKF